MADLSMIKDRIQNAAWLTICTPSGEKTDIEFLVAGPDSDEFRKAEDRLSNQTARRAIQRPGKALRLTAEELKERNQELLMAVTLDWKNVSFNGEELPFTKENLRVIYTEPAFGFIFDQALDFVNERSNFFTNSN